MKPALEVYGIDRLAYERRMRLVPIVGYVSFPAFVASLVFTAHGRISLPLGFILVVLIILANIVAGILDRSRLY